MNKPLKIISYFMASVLLAMMLAFLLPACGMTYAVFFYDENGAFIQSVRVKQGESAQIETPTKESTTYFTYTFSNWTFENGDDATEALENVTSNLFVYANFTENDRYYRVSFYNYDNTPIVEEIIVKAGESPLGFTFTPPQSDVYEYTFKCWVDEDGNDMSQALEHVLQDLTVYASYTQELKFYSLTLDENISVLYGDVITSENDHLARLPYGAEITISYTVPEGYSSAELRVRGAQRALDQEGVYRVIGDVSVSLVLEV